MATYTKTVWQDLPNQTTPISASNLNKIENAIETLYNMMYPVGSIYMSVNSTNPSTLFGGTWVAWGSGRVPVGINTNDTDFNTVEKTGGEKKHTLSVDELPDHTHGLSANILLAYHDGIGKISNTTGINVGRFNEYPSEMETSHTGGGQAHNILQPYITCYMWKRVS